MNGWLICCGLVRFHVWDTWIVSCFQTLSGNSIVTTIVAPSHSPGQCNQKEFNRACFVPFPSHVPNIGDVSVSVLFASSELGLSFHRATLFRSFQSKGCSFFCFAAGKCVCLCVCVCVCVCVCSRASVCVCVCVSER